MKIDANVKMLVEESNHLPYSPGLVFCPFPEICFENSNIGNSLQ